MSGSGALGTPIVLQACDLAKRVQDDSALSRWTHIGRWLLDRAGIDYDDEDDPLPDDFWDDEENSDAGGLVDGITLTVTAGERLRIVAPPSTGVMLVKLLSGLSLPTHGSVSADGRVIAVIPWFEKLARDVSVQRAVLAHGDIARTPRSHLRPRIPAILEHAGLASERLSSIDRCAKAARERLAIATAIATDATVYAVSSYFWRGGQGFRDSCAERLAARLASGAAVIELAADEGNFLLDDGPYVTLRHGRIVE